jgi:hypothetical protein
MLANQAPTFEAEVDEVEGGSIRMGEDDGAVLAHRVACQHANLCASFSLLTLRIMAISACKAGPKMESMANTLWHVFMNHAEE